MKQNIRPLRQGKENTLYLGCDRVDEILSRARKPGFEVQLYHWWVT